MDVLGYLLQTESANLLLVLGTVVLITALAGRLGNFVILSGFGRFLVGGLGILFLLTSFFGAGLFRAQEEDENKTELTPSSTISNFPSAEATDRPSIGTSATAAVGDASQGTSCESRVVIREQVANNTTMSFTRCPVGEIKYLIQADDLLNSVLLDCPGTSNQTIPFYRNDQRSEGQLLPVFETVNFRSFEGCKVHFSITSSVGNIGYTIWQELVSQ
ncbi:MAG: hypothetical protein KF821_08605 [Anaerolineales bacterium]|nr:hypothetical protein [Anaerolineales bacterium]